MHTALVVTSISPPTPILRALAGGARATSTDFILAGDTRSPADFQLDGCTFLDIEAQRRTGLAFAQACPTRSYARKNIGYLVAIMRGARLIFETDDDNWPTAAFFERRERVCRGATLQGNGWTNIYRYFSEATIWPRGLPLDSVHAPLPPYESLAIEERDCPIQQGLADDNPDVDAIYRLLLPLPQRFRSDRRVIAATGTWCPFNSQNTSWWPDAYPLLYLPVHCSFRMTDIWRSFVAQRIAWENGWSILIHEPTVRQERNDHDLMRDFADEVPGYTNNRRIGETLQGLALRRGKEHTLENLRICYEALIGLGVVGADESRLLEAWVGDLKRLGAAS